MGARLGGSAARRVGRVDLHAHRELIDQHNISGLPTFVLFPRGAHKARGLVFRGARSAGALVDFALSPAAYLLEADVAARGERCLDTLLARGVVGALPEEANNSQRAQAVVDAAHRCVRALALAAGAWPLTRRVVPMCSAAVARAWGDALEALLCVAATPALRRTGVGSAPGLWNLLDNARLQYDAAALQRVHRSAGSAAAEEEAEGDANAASADTAPDVDVWAAFHAAAARKAATLGERGLPADEL